MDYKFSVIMPVYNAEKTVEKAIKSVLNDNNKNVELVIVNDGSTDKSDEIIKKYVADPRVSYHVQENSGVSAARNLGLSVSKGEYIAFLDSDDFFTSDAFLKLTEYVNKYDCGILGFGFYSESFYRNGEIKSTKANAVSGVLDFKVCDACTQLKYIFSSSKVLLQTSWNKVFKKEYIVDHNIKFDTNIVCYENLTFIFEVMNFCDRIVFVPDICYHFCRYEQNSNVLMKRRKAELTSSVSSCLRSFNKLSDKYNYSAEFRSFMYEQFFSDFIYCSKKVFLPENEMAKQDRIRLFSEFLNDEMFLFLKDNYFGGFRFYKIIYLLHNNKLDNLAYYLYKKNIVEK